MFRFHTVYLMYQFSNGKLPKVFNFSFLPTSNKYSYSARFATRCTVVFFLFCFVVFLISLKLARIMVNIILDPLALKSGTKLTSF